jgi:putative hemolysin
MEDVNIIYMIVILFLLLFFSAFFSGSETALMAISKLRLRHISETMPVRARIVENVLKKPERLIGVILLGNNLVNVAMSALATAMAITIWGERGIAYVTAVLTIFLLIFAEITPKVYAKYFNERVSLITAPILRILMIIFNPFVSMITFLSNKILLLIGVDVTRIKNPLMTEEEIRTCIKMGWDDGTITLDERKMLSRVFTLNDKTVEEVMVSKADIVLLDEDLSIEEIYKIIIKTGHSRFPIRRNADSNIIGFIHAKDIFHFIEEKKDGLIKDIIRPPYFVPSYEKIDVQLRRFQANKLHQAIVLDKMGNVVGLITLEDILEELVGSIQDEHD